MNDQNKSLTKDENRDPITGEPGSHPVGTGLGTAGGFAAGAAVGVFGGPVGAVVGGVIGGIIGAATGHAVAEGLDPTAENLYWKENYRNEPYYEDHLGFSDYEPAYRMGSDNYVRNPGRTFEETEHELAGKWESVREGSSLKWEEARHAARAGWHRVERALPGDADGDGR